LAEQHSSIQEFRLSPRSRRSLEHPPLRPVQRLLLSIVLLRILPISRTLRLFKQYPDTHVLSLLHFSFLSQKSLDSDVFLHGTQPVSLFSHTVFIPSVLTFSSTLSRPTPLPKFFSAFFILFQLYPHFTPFEDGTQLEFQSFFRTSHSLPVEESERDILRNNSRSMILHETLRLFLRGLSRGHSERF